jgi:predicted methyltransferase
LLDQNESFDHNQTPQQEYHHPKPLLSHLIYKDIHDPLNNEMRFILNHIVERLKFRVSKMKQNRFFWKMLLIKTNKPSLEQQHHLKFRVSKMKQNRFFWKMFHHLNKQTKTVSSPQHSK